ncbi:EAL domain-containing protein [Persephonella sp.]|uniref:sensor domain-containing protein n=1 Tax=Persephonella sp. TaxID=2060922 RepID=UPI0026262DE1|nr:EAL domain-containing protein [Persephonella sp.]
METGRIVMHLLKNPAAVFTSEGKYVLSNDIFKKILGIEESILKNKMISQIFKDTLFDKIKKSIQKNRFFYQEIQINKKDYSMLIFPVVHNLKEKLLLFLVDAHSIYEKEELLNALIEKTPAGTFIYKDRFVFSNKTFQEITEYTQEELKNIKPREIVHPKFRDDVIQIVKKRLSGENLEKHYDLLTLISKTGKERHIELVTTTIKYQGGYAGMGVCVDRTEKVELEKRLNYLYTHDEVTGLPNRRKFMEYLDKAVQYAAKNSHLIAVILIDVKDMKLINKEYGYSTGDKILKEIGNRLKGLFKAVDYVAKVGDDKFGVLIYAFKNLEKLSEKIENIMKKIEGTYTIYDFKIPVEIKMGISIFPKDGHFPEDLYKNAEIALLKAKETPGRKFEFFSKSSYSEISRILNLKSKIREIIQKNSIKMFYQPIVNLKDNNIYGFESLFRLITEENGIIMPKDIIPTAEKTGLIIDLGEKIIDSVIDFSRTVPEKIKLSINISPVQLNQPDFDKNFLNKLAKAEINPEKLIIEITESAILENVGESIKKLRNLKDNGIKVSIDDFGTGYSSLNYLKKIPADYLKIDISFVSGIGKDKSDEMIVKTIISMAKNLGMKAVAEGIENEDQLRFLKQEGCDLGQGYYFGKPYPQNEINRILEKGL